MEIVNWAISSAFLKTEPIMESFCYTNIKLIKSSFTWTVNNFSCWIGDKNDSLTSSRFSTGDNDQLEWSLTIYPKGFKESNNLGLYLTLESSNKSEVNTKVKFSIMNVKLEAKIVTEFEHKFKEKEYFGYKNLVERKNLLNKENDFLLEDKVIIIVDIEVTSGKNYVSPKSQFAKDFGSIFDNKLLSDVTLLVGEQKFKAHKVVLAARSPVFAAMFTHEMEEQNKNVVNILDVDHEVFEEMLLFMYTEKAPNLEKMAKELLSVADKYMLENLKIMCGNELWLNLTIETATDTLTLADLHNAKQLKTQTMEFIYSHLTEIISTIGAGNIIAKHPVLAAELLHVLAHKANKLSK